MSICLLKFYLHISLFIYLFCRDWTQGLTYLLYMSYISVFLFFSFIFQLGHMLILLGLDSDLNPFTSTSLVAGTTGVHHYSQLLFEIESYQHLLRLALNCSNSPDYPGGQEFWPSLSPSNYLDCRRDPLLFIYLQRCSKDK
jgi:hypothetical protein